MNIVAMAKTNQRRFGFLRGGNKMNHVNLNCPSEVSSMTKGSGSNGEDTLSRRSHSFVGTCLDTVDDYDIDLESKIVRLDDVNLTDLLAAAQTHCNDSYKLHAAYAAMWRRASDNNVVKVEMGYREIVEFVVQTGLILHSESAHKNVLVTSCGLVACLCRDSGSAINTQAFSEMGGIPAATTIVRLNMADASLVEWPLRAMLVVLRNARDSQLVSDLKDDVLEEGLIKTVVKTANTHALNNNTNMLELCAKLLHAVSLIVPGPEFTASVEEYDGLRVMMKIASTALDDDSTTKTQHRDHPPPLIVKYLFKVLSVCSQHSRKCLLTGENLPSILVQGFRSFPTDKVVYSSVCKILLDFETHACGRDAVEDNDVEQIIKLFEGDSMGDIVYDNMVQHTRDECIQSLSCRIKKIFTSSLRNGRMSETLHRNDDKAKTETIESVLLETAETTKNSTCLSSLHGASKSFSVAEMCGHMLGRILQQDELVPLTRRAKNSSSTDDDDDDDSLARRMAWHCLAAVLASNLTADHVAALALVAEAVRDRVAPQRSAPPTAPPALRALVDVALSRGDDDDDADADAVLFRDVVDLTRRRGDHDTTRRGALRALATIAYARGPGEGQCALSDAESDALVRAFSEHSVSCAVTRRDASDLFAKLATSRTNAASLTRRGLLDSLLDCMDRHPADVPFLENACRVVVHTTLHDDDHDDTSRVLSSILVDRIVNSVCLFMEIGTQRRTPRLQRAGCSVLWAISSFVAQRPRRDDDDAGDRLDVRRIFHCVVTAFEERSLDDDDGASNTLAETVFGTLWCLSAFVRDDRDETAESLRWSRVVSVAARALEDARDDVLDDGTLRVVRAVFGTLLNASSSAETTPCDAAFHPETVRAVCDASAELRVLRDDDDDDERAATERAGCALLARLSERVPRVVSECGGVDYALSVLEDDSTDAETRRDACATLTNACLDDELSRRRRRRRQRRRRRGTASERPPSSNQEKTALECLCRSIETAESDDDDESARRLSLDVVSVVRRRSDSAVVRKYGKRILMAVATTLQKENDDELLEGDT